MITFFPKCFKYQKYRKTTFHVLFVITVKLKNNCKTMFKVRLSVTYSVAYNIL